MKKQFLSVVTALCLALILLPASALAAEDVAEVNGVGYLTLQDAISAAEELANEASAPVTITLLESVTGDAVTFDQSGSYILDLNGETYTSNSDYDVIMVKSGDVNLTIQNGNLIGHGLETYGIYVYAVNAANTYDNVTVTLDNVHLDVTDQGLGVQGLNSNNNLIVRNSSVKSTTTAIYFPPKTGTIIIEDSVITGVNNGIVIKGGAVVISGDKTSVTATGMGVESDVPYQGDPDNPGSFPQSGSAIYVEGGYTIDDGGQRPISLDIKGGTFTSQQADAVKAKFIKDETVQTVEISDGDFSSDVSQFCAPGLAATDPDEDGNYTIDADPTMFESGGRGTENDPFVITSAEQLKNFRDSVNNGNSYAGVYIKLGNSIDLSAESDSWTPIGTETAYPDLPPVTTLTGNEVSFQGVFDGAGYSITGLKMNATDSKEAGLFKILKNATVKNLTADADITLGSNSWVGVIAGRAENSQILNCKVSGEITSATGKLSSAVAAGVVEYMINGSVVQDTTSDVNIHITSGTYVYAGGIACEVNGSQIIDCVNNGTLTGASTGEYSYVGGIAAYMKNGSTISDCTNNGAIDSGDDSAPYATAGGIVGQIWHENQATTETVSNCTNYGDVTATVQSSSTDSYAGGIVGEAYQYDPNTWALDSRSDITITNCTNTGTLSVVPANENHLGGVLAWGDVEWKMNLSNNAPGGYQESGWFSAPAEYTFEGNGQAEDPLSYEYNKGWLHVFETVTLKDVTIGASDDLTVIDGQTMILEGATNGTVTVQSGGILINNSDSTTVTGAAASIGSTYYSTLQDAVDHVSNNGTITLLANNDETVTVSRTVTFTLDRNSNNFTGSIRGGTNTTVTVSGDTYTCVYRVPSQGGSSGGSSDPSYSPIMDVTGNGDVSVSPRTPSEGDEVTITVEPDRGYEVGDVTVTDRDGDTVRVTANRDGTYTFEQPRGRVTIEVTFVPTGTATFFTDVPESFWAYNEIKWAYDNGYVNGTSATTFSPNSSISRQQVWMILARLSGADPANMAEARTWAIENGISDGTTPGNAVTRQQLVALLYRYATMMGYANDARADLTSYPDAGTVASYAVEPMQWSVANNIVAGTSDGTLNPTGTATRAQFAVILYRFWSQIG